MVTMGRLESLPAATNEHVKQTIGLGIVLKASLLSPLFAKATDELRVRLKALGKTLPGE